MKKIILGLLLVSSCKINETKIHVTKTSVNKCIHNLEKFEEFVLNDYVNGDIEDHCFDMYYLIINNTLQSLKEIKKHKLNTNKER